MGKGRGMSATARLVERYGVRNTRSMYVGLEVFFFVEGFVGVGGKVFVERTGEAVGFMGCRTDD